MTSTEAGQLTGAAVPFSGTLVSSGVVDIPVGQSMTIALDTRHTHHIVVANLVTGPDNGRIDIFYEIGGNTVNGPDDLLPGVTWNQAIPNLASVTFKQDGNGVVKMAFSISIT